MRELKIRGDVGPDEGRTTCSRGVGMGAHAGMWVGLNVENVENGEMGKWRKVRNIEKGEMGKCGKWHIGAVGIENVESEDDDGWGVESTGKTTKIDRNLWG